MKKLSAFVVAIVAIVVCSVASAETKVVVFDLEAAILNTDAAKKASEALKKDAEYASLQATYDSLRADMAALQKKQESKGMTWDANTLAEHRKTVEYKRADLELAVKKLQAEQNAAVRGLLQEYQGKAKKALDEVIKAEGISIVLSAKQSYYAEPSADITGKVTAKLNKM
ncbi:OmpH family outer membrane protein [Marinibactrum halimedae]|uniref:OmpH family outer membrane protein n=1 Tax=Marinibactrum halimedae TaxID=1444977 RepID=A0AA37TDQ2_9GAMM|nr:OmpH family outer membrane protein [Marinibactrum halimedae]MCD9457580.1 OmpH family outer membrane protein [Marinibactrum halimedae]GLS28000.1 hypothetical protein GCM10007877_37190 [Marinibactrum halimedae]